MQTHVPTLTKLDAGWQLANGIIEIAFSAQGRLLALGHLETGHRFELPELGGTIWRVLLRDADGVIHTVLPEGRCEITHSQQGEELELILVWPGGPVAVTARVALGRGSTISHWHVAVENRTEHALWEVEFPRIEGLTPIAGDGELDRLAIPFLWGALLPNPVGLICRGELKRSASDFAEYSLADATDDDGPRVAFSYPGMMTMQFLALYHPARAGIYFGAHDAQANLKRFGAYGTEDGDRLDLVMQNFPEERIRGGLDYWLPYPAVVGVFAGDWWKASELYRAWAVRQEWCAKGPLTQRSDIPQWIKDVDLWYWNYVYREQHSPEEIVPAVLYLKERMDTDICIHWYEWNDWSFNENIPESFPMSYAWQERLREGLKQLHDAGVHAIPYFNARLWDCTTDAYRTLGGPESLVLDENGGPTGWTTRGRAANWLTMCPSARAWQDRILHLMRETVEQVGMDGAYLDQITSSFVLPCFVESHGHPRGGGNSWYRGYRQMVDRIRSTINTRHPGVIWTSEDVIECYLDQFDTNLARHAADMNDRFGDEWLPIPMFSSVYHDYAMTYGSVQTMDEAFEDTYYLGEALVFAGGSQMIICGYFAKHVGTDEHGECLDYLERLVRARKRARKYLTYGRWLPPVAMDVEQVEVRWSDDGKPKRVPAVVTTSWGAADGSVAVVMVNHTAAERTVRYSFRADDYGLSGRGLRLSELTQDGLRPLAEGLPPDFGRQECIAPRQPRIFVVQ